MKAESVARGQEILDEIEIVTKQIKSLESVSEVGNISIHGMTKTKESSSAIHQFKISDSRQVDIRMSGSTANPIKTLADRFVQEVIRELNELVILLNKELKELD